MNLLTDPIFQVLTTDGLGRISLPDMLTGLGAGRIEGLPGLQRHQADIFHIFLCYLAGAVLVRAGKSDPVQEESFWLDGIRELTGRGDDLAWTLAVEDPTQPAFMQPPAPSRKVYEKEYKLKATTSDELDLLQTAKNHDVKTARAHDDHPESWCYALISFQTASGFLGQGNYGIARMNGGFGSRVCVGWQGDRRLPTRFQRDVGVLLAQRRVLLSPPYPYRESGAVLLWLFPWDGRDSLPLSDLDPFFIEIARRIRILPQGGFLTVYGGNSTCARVSAAEFLGNIGDPWTPILENKNSALTVSKAGFTPSLVRNLIFWDGYRPCAMQKLSKEDKAGWFCASVLVRGQGTTDGFHEAAVQVPEQAKTTLMGRGPGRDRLSKMSKEGLDMAGKLQNRVLKPALFYLLEGGPDSINWEKPEVRSWVEKLAMEFTERWRDLYFPWLWSTLDSSDDAENFQRWFEALRANALETFENAVVRAPLRHGRNYKAITGAQRVFHGSMRKQFPDNIGGDT